MRTAVAGAALLLAGCTATANDPGPRETAELADTLKGRTAAPAERCLPTSTVESPQIIGETLVYRVGSTLYRVEAEGGCPSLRGDPLLVVEVFGGQICANDRFRTVQRSSTIPGPYCRFGQFVAYRRTP